MQPSITLYFDLQSPYAYITFHILQTSPVFQRCTMTFTPIYLAALVKITGASAPWNNPNRIAWIQKDLNSWCQDYAIPWRAGWPSLYPTGMSTLQVQRVLTACSEYHAESYESVLAALYKEFWVNKQAVQRAEIFESILCRFIGRTAAADLMQKSTSKQIKSRLKQNTAEAISSGAPGLPWLKVTNDKGEIGTFWGFDHLGQVEKFLFSDTKTTTLRSHL